jgi:hypothetical protein
MLDTPEESDATRVREWLSRALESGQMRGLDPVGLSKHCGVSRQAVNGWLTTGRITKTNLAKATVYFGFGPNFGDTNVTVLQAYSNTLPWPFPRIDPARYFRLESAQRDRIEAFAQGVLSEQTESHALTPSARTA